MNRFFDILSPNNSYIVDFREWEKSEHKTPPEVRQSRWWERVRFACRKDKDVFFVSKSDNEQLYKKIENIAGSLLKDHPEAFVSLQGKFFTIAYKKRVSQESIGWALMPQGRRAVALRVDSLLQTKLIESTDLSVSIKALRARFKAGVDCFGLSDTSLFEKLLSMAETLNKPESSEVAKQLVEIGRSAFNEYLSGGTRDFKAWENKIEDRILEACCNGASSYDEFMKVVVELGLQGVCKEQRLESILKKASPALYVEYTCKKFEGVLAESSLSRDENYFRAKYEWFKDIVKKHEEIVKVGLKTRVDTILERWLQKIEESKRNHLYVSFDSLIYEWDKLPLSSKNKTLQEVLSVLRGDGAQGRINRLSVRIKKDIQEERSMPYLSTLRSALPAVYAEVVSLLKPRFGS